MPRQAGDLGLVHGIDHRRRGAGAAQRVADIDDVRDAGALAAQFARHRDAKEPFGTHGGDRFLRESRIAVDRGGMRRRDRGSFFAPRQEIRFIDGVQIIRGDENAARGVARRLHVLVHL